MGNEQERRKNEQEAYFQNSEQSELHPPEYPSASMLLGTSPELQECCQGARGRCAISPLGHLHWKADDGYCLQCLAAPQNCSLLLSPVILPLLLHMHFLTTVMLNLNILVFLLTALRLAFLGFFAGTALAVCSSSHLLHIKHPLPYLYHAPKC